MTKFLISALTALTLSMCIGGSIAKADGDAVVPVSSPVWANCQESLIQVPTATGLQWYQVEDCQDSE